MGVMEDCAFFHFLTFGDFVKGSAVGVSLRHLAVFLHVFAFTFIMMGIYPNLIEWDKFMDSAVSAMAENDA